MYLGYAGTPGMCPLTTLVATRGFDVKSYLASLPNPGHQDHSMCRAAIYVGASTPGEAAASLVANLSGYDGRHARFTRYLPEGAQEEMAWMIDYYYNFHPDGVVRVGNYTPRGRKRRGLHGVRQSRFLTIRPAGECWIYARGVHYGGDTFEVTRQGITVRCRCKGMGAHPQTTVVWTPA